MDIRPAHPDDADTIVALDRLVAPYLVTTADQIRFHLSSKPAAGAYAGYVASLDGEVVGWASGGLIPGASPPEDGQVNVRVHPDHRGRGIGSALVEAIHSHLRSAGARRSRVFADPQAVAFAARRGYAQTRQVHYAGVDLRALPPQPPAPPGLRLSPLAELDPRIVYEADLVAQRTKPGDTKIEATAYEDWLTGVWQAPAMMLDLSFAAVASDEVACFTLAHGDYERIWSRMTGTLPSYRGQGLAKVVKWAALDRAAKAGVTGAFTANYDGNQPMLAVNDWLGYRRTATHSVLMCTL